MAYLFRKECLAMANNRDFARNPTFFDVFRYKKSLISCFFMKNWVEVLVFVGQV